MPYFPPPAKTGSSLKVHAAEVTSTADMAPIPGVSTLVPGLTKVMTAAALTDVFVIACSIDFSNGPTTSVAALFIDGVAFNAGSPGVICRDNGGTHSQTWIVTGLATGDHTFSIQAVQISGVAHTAAANSTMTVTQYST